MSGSTIVTYPPLDTPKAVAADVWVVDGPVVRFGLGPFTMPFPTRMTVIRLAGPALLVHSPTQLTPALRSAVAELGPVRWIVGPNRIHYVSIPEWHAAFPDADVYLAPRIREQAAGRADLDFPTKELAAAAGYPWDADITTLPVEGAYMTEFEFFHRRSRTLVLTDLIENFEAGKLPSWPLRLLARLGGVVDPHGSMPRDMRASFRGNRRALRAAVETMIAWQPERIILAHGRWYEKDGAAELRRAFAWLLE